MRTYQEMDVGPVSPNSTTTRMQAIAPTTKLREKQNVIYMLHFEKKKTLRGVLSMPLYSMKEGKDDERN